MKTVLALLLAIAPAAAAGAGFANPELRVDAAWLRAHLGDPALRLVDARPKDAYDRGHLPGAVSLPVAETLDPAGAANHPAPLERLAALLGARGLDDQHLVIVYDDGWATPAARVFWTLELAGHPAAAVLDGGVRAWRAAGGLLTLDPARAQPVTFRVRPQLWREAAKAGVAAAVGDARACIVDVRSPAEYRGEDVRARAGGHVPGAVHLEWNRVFAADGRLKSAAELSALYAERGVTPDKQVITHCHTGQRSSVAYWTLRLLGYPRVGNYAGSWAEWGNDPGTPKTIGAQP